MELFKCKKTLEEKFSKQTTLYTPSVTCFQHCQQSTVRSPSRDLTGKVNIDN